MIRLDHVNVVVPPGRTEAVVPFYEALGLVRVPKHGSRAAGAWFELDGGQQVHVSERDGLPHPEQHFAVRVDDLEALVARLLAGGHPWQPKGPGRGTTSDPCGNAVEVFGD